MLMMEYINCFKTNVFLHSFPVNNKKKEYETFISDASSLDCAFFKYLFLLMIMIQYGTPGLFSSTQKIYFRDSFI